MALLVILDDGDLADSNTCGFFVLRDSLHVSAAFRLHALRPIFLLEPVSTTLPLRPLTSSYCSMPGREYEDIPAERATKRRRISTATAPHEGSPSTMDRETSTQTPEKIPQPLPEIELTPIENTLKTLLLDVAQYIRQRAAEKGSDNAAADNEMVLRFTGGWVRDKLLGVHSHDIDVGISNMTGYQFGMALKEYLDAPENLAKYKRNLPDGELSDAIVSLHKIEANPEKSKHLETVTTKIFGLDIDLVNLRKETYSEDSRNPQMEFGTAEEDAMRRDATVNALFYNLNRSVVEDFTGRGIEDMKSRIIRTPLEPYQTFKDDPLRVLRLIRFASRLGYVIDKETELAMQNDDIKEALKIKISKERVLAELDKMLRGPDPRGALQYIDRLGLYSTIFANHRDDAQADTSSWSLAYDAVEKFLRSSHVNAGDAAQAAERVRSTLIGDLSDEYYCWIIAAFAPWATVSGREPKTQKEKRPPPRVTEVARDSLRADNRSASILTDAANSAAQITGIKGSLLAGSIPGTDAEVRQQIGLKIREWRKDWRLCVVMSILLEIMKGRPFDEVIREYDEFLSYISSKDLLGVCELKPIVNGGEILAGLDAEKGPWMSQAVDMVIKWQLLHPEISEKEKALEMLQERKSELDFEPAK
ncbi:poly(A) polymerase [Paecilomyces variotii No. 5]|uniref:Poly(A) polymerase n=1 Tax=Byssochlamys spectabilis (strain No. 5 / NBRC 109023) TaxID=1356009 RepID=V5FV36_BYSSN|nr:poly(A) polymerase [Paecilomyces variotii No. 5]